MSETEQYGENYKWLLDFLKSAAPKNETPMWMYKTGPEQDEALKKIVEGLNKIEERLAKVEGYLETIAKHTEFDQIYKA